MSRINCDFSGRVYSKVEEINLIEKKDTKKFVVMMLKILFGTTQIVGLMHITAHCCEFYQSPI